MQTIDTVAETRDSALTEALTQWREVLGPERVKVEGETTARFGDNEAAARRCVPAVLQPRSTGEVSAIVRIAGRHRIPLYPISRGRNWGYGGASPATDRCVVVDLSGMDEILDFDAELGIVTVQPGVTPQQLHEYLKAQGADFLVPVCGAGPHYSLLGNALERGYGVTPHTDHFGAVTSLEAVLPNGAIYRSALTSLGAAATDRAFKWGVGPYVDGLFTQGNFGVVTAASIALAPRPECTEAFLARIDSDNDLEKAIDAVRTIISAVGGVIGSVNVMNDRRVLSMAEPYPRDEVAPGTVMSDELVGRLRRQAGFGAWTVGGMICGDRHVVAAARRQIRRHLKPLARQVLFFNRRKIDLLFATLGRLPFRWARNLHRRIGNLDEAFKVAEGKPSDVALPLCYWRSGIQPPADMPMDPARDGCGLIWYSPLVPMKAAQVRVYVDIVHRICTEHGIEPLITLTSLSNRCFDSTVPLLFDRSDPLRVDAARRCYRALFTAGQAHGFLPYRVGIDQMDLIVRPGTPYWDMVATLKHAIDPGNIIAPGRYGS